MAAKQSAFLGDPPTLPLRIAVQVAWTSIRVRISRSLVTVSSVILAVAFLLVVVGEDLANKSVYAAFARDDEPRRQAIEIKSALQVRRSAVTMLGLLATQPQEVTAWAAELGEQSIPAFEPAQAAHAVRLVDWISALKAGDQYQFIGIREPSEWLLGLDGKDRDGRDEVAVFLDKVADFRSARFILSEDEMRSLAADMPKLRAAVAGLLAAEQKRLQQISAAGGVDAVMLLAQRGASDGELASAGLPLGQVLPGLSREQRQRLQQQLLLDRARADASSVVIQANNSDPSLLLESDVADWPRLFALIDDQLKAPGATPAKRMIASAGPSGTAFNEQLAKDSRSAATRAAFLAAFNASLPDQNLKDEAAWSGFTLSAEINGFVVKARLNDRQQTYFNRLLLSAAFAPAIKPTSQVTEPLVLKALIDGQQTDHPQAAATLAEIEGSLNGTDLAGLRAELDRSQRLETLKATFTRMGYDPGESGAKTFWLVVLSLIVCIVGIVNTMMMAVTERFREIATMKCLGAVDAFILKSFLIESGAVGAVGAFIGAMIGALIVIVQAGARFGGPFWASIPLSELLVAALVALAAGLVLSVAGALLPALKAARMHPIEAMRIDA